MVNRFFDFEVFPNWWLCVFGDLPDDHKSVTQDIKNDFVYVTSDDKDARDKLINLLREENHCSIGYNIKNYDLVIANAIYQGFTPEQVKIVNDLIINPGCAWDTKEHIRLQPFAKKKLSGLCYQDLMDDGAGSLKDKEATLGLSVLESSVDFNKEDLTEQDKLDVIYYCKQDVYASMQFYIKVVHPYTLTKLALGKHFNIPEDTCHKSTNARLVSMALGAKRKEHGDADKIDIELPAKIKDYCYENLPREVLEQIRTSQEGFTVDLFDNEVSFGNGGVHSTYKGKFVTPPCVYLESNDEWVIRNVDAASYYPSEMIQFDLLSRNISNKQVFIDIFNERIAIKHKKDKTPEDNMAQLADKLVLNTTFGASGNKFLDLYDPYMCTSVCRVGQIFLASFANKIYHKIPTAKIIQTNTDGICCYLPKKDLPILESLMAEWSNVSGINMEMDVIEKLWQRDVNNYLMILDDDGHTKIKRKGGWLNDDYFRPGYVTTASANAFVCSKAVIDFLINGNDIITSIVQNNNLADFSITCTKGPTYRGVIQKFADGSEQELFKANRVIATKDEYCGELFKYKMYKGEKRFAKMPSIPEHCLTVNDDLSNYNFKEMQKQIDYTYYIQRALDLLNIEWWHLDGNDIYIDKSFEYNF